MQAVHIYITCIIDKKLMQNIAVANLNEHCVCEIISTLGEKIEEIE